jgi:hypothetical protein
MKNIVTKMDAEERIQQIFPLITLKHISIIFVYHYVHRILSECCNKKCI